MSTENEQPIEAIVQAVCGTCGEVIADGDERASCAVEKCGHLTCVTCFRKLLAVMFGQPALYYPLKCVSCGEPLDEHRFLPILTKENLYEKYIACLFSLFWAKDCVHENEVLIQCKNFEERKKNEINVVSLGPFCPYLEIHTTDACSPQFFTCQNPNCHQKSCLICLHPIENIEMESHHQSHCHELRSYKQKIEQAITTGSQQHCPHCQLAGMKDDGCTHIVCERCHHPWCYLCGMKEEECPVIPGAEPSLSAHNEDWHLSRDRCPMTLSYIHQLDKRWPEDEEGCLEYFHRYRTLAHLFDLLNIVGEDKFNEVNQHFGIIDGSGFTMEEIKDWPKQLFIDYSIETTE